MKGVLSSAFLFGRISLALSELTAVVGLSSPPDYSELKEITGTFEKLSFKPPGRYGTEIVLLHLNTGNDVRHIWSGFHRDRFAMLSPGEPLQIRADSDNVFRPSVLYIYELKHGDRVLISYEEKTGSDVRKTKQIRTLSKYFLTIGLLLCCSLFFWKLPPEDNPSSDGNP